MSDADRPTASRGWRGKRPQPTEGAPPSTWQEALTCVEAWIAVKPAHRREFAAELTAWLNAEAGGQEFELLPDEFGVHAFAGLKHRSDVEFVAIPGGQMQMGFTADDIFAVMSVFPPDQVADFENESWASHFLDARPPRIVSVAPFLVSRDLVQIDEDNPLQAIDRDGFRMISEAEWEWLGREGMAVCFVNVPPGYHPLGPTRVPPVQQENGWGIRGLLNEEVPVADTIQGGYVGAPTTSEPWIIGDPLDPTLSRGCRMGHSWWQHPQEAIALHAANRESIRIGKVFRLSWPLPVEPAGSLPPYRVPGHHTCEGALEDTTPGRDTANPARARLAMLAASQVPGADTARFVTSGLKFANGQWGRAVLSAITPAWPEPALAAFLDTEEEATKVIAAIRSRTPEARAWAAYWAVRLDQRAEEALTALIKKMVRERKPLAKASIILAIGMLAKRLDVKVDKWGKWADTDDPMVRAAVAIARHGLGHDVGAELRAAQSVPVNKDLPWFDGDLAAEATRLVR